MLNLLFPAYCFHCDARLEKLKGQLCEDCKQQLTLVSPQGRCTKCFGEITKLSGVCFTCRSRSHAFKNAAACFEAIGPASSLLREFKDRGRLHLARDLAAFMAVQMKKLDWPWPHLIVPIPLAWEERLWQGFDPNHLLAEALGKWTDCPVVRQLKKGADYYLNQKADLSDKVVLLVAGTLSEISNCAEILRQSGPSAIYGLSFLASLDLS